jgi:hypothetical protein
VRLTKEAVLHYPSPNGFDGICHVRVYEAPGELPVVICGELEDNPGNSITNAIENVAAAVQAAFFRDGREFRLVEHYPYSISGSRDPECAVPTYDLVSFEHRSAEEDPEAAQAGGVYVGEVDAEGATLWKLRSHGLLGDFRHPRWQRIEEVGELVGDDAEVRHWPPNDYTALGVGGAQAERLREAIDRHAGERRAALEALLDEVTGEESS